MYYFTYCDPSHKPLADKLAASFRFHMGQELNIHEIPTFEVDGKPYHFHKINLIIEMLSKYTEIGYIDADVIVTMRFSPPSFDEYNVWMAPDHGVSQARWLIGECEHLLIDLKRYMNAGVIFADRTSAFFWQNVMRVYERKLKPFLNPLTADQTTINYLASLGLHEALYAKVGLMPCAYNWMPGKSPFMEFYPYMVHLAGAGRVDFKLDLADKFYEDNYGMGQEAADGYHCKHFPFKISEWAK